MLNRRLLIGSFGLLVAGAFGCSSSGSAPETGPRTVNAKLQTVFTKDDGTTAVVAGWDQNELATYAVTALLVPDASSAGYTSFPVTVAADGSFSVANVPAGAYFIQVDNLVKTVHSQTVERTLYRTTSSTPDLTLAIHGRADRALGSGTVQMNVTGLTALSDPATVKFPSTQLRLTIAQASIASLGVQSLLTPKPQPGDTSVAGSFPYGNIIFTDYLPDASKGDVTYFHERSDSELGSGPTAASYHFTSNYLRSTSLTLANGGSATLSGAMVAAPQTGSLHANLKMSQFAALASAVHPGATPSATFTNSLTVFTLPHAATVFGSIVTTTPLALLTMGPQLTADVDYGTLAYGRLPESSWTEFIQFLYTYDFQLPALPGGEVAGTGQETYVKTALVSSAPTSFAPAISPPRSPLVGGADAFQARTGVGLTPAISWSAPATGTPASYTLRLYFFGFSGPLTDGVLSQLTVVGLTDTNFKVPPGILAAGFTYAGSITATTVPLNAAGAPILQSAIVGDAINADFGPFAP